MKSASISGKAESSFRARNLAPLKRALFCIARDLAKRTVARTGCVLDWLFGRMPGSGVGILMYHRVVDHVPGMDPPTWNITPAKFEAQLAGLLERGFEPWPLRRLLAFHESNRNVPPNVFVVTFDDGHESVYLNAWPVLRSLGVPATVFLATAFLDSQSAFPFDDWSGAGSDQVPIEHWRPMSSAQCTEMARDGLIELGAHTHTHQDFFARLQDFRQDLSINVNLLQSVYQTGQPALAFPFGRVNKGMLEMARSLGVTCAMTTTATPIDPKTPPLGWGRFDVEAWDTAATLAAKLDGWYSWAVRLRKRVC